MGTAGWRLGVFFVIAAALSFLPALPALYMGAPIPHGTGQLWMHRDEATVLADSARLIWGELIYRDFFEFPGPVPFFLNAAVFKVFGVSVLVARWFFLINVSVTGTLLAFTVRSHLGPLAGLAVCLFHSAALVGFWLCNYPHWFSEMFLVAALSLYSADESAKLRRLGSGVCSGLALWSIQSVGIPTAITLLLLSLTPGLAQRRPGLALRMSGHFFAGLAVASSLVLLPFLLGGGLSDIFYDMFVWPFTNYGEGQTDNTGYASDYSHSVRAHAQLSAAPRYAALATISVNVVLPFVLAATALPHLVNLWLSVLRRFEPAPSSIVAVSALAALTPLLFGATRSDQVHIAFLGGVALLGIAAGLKLTPRKLQAASVVLFCTAAVLAATTLAFKLSRTDLSSDRWEAYVARLDDTKWVEKVSVPDDTLVDGTHWAGMRYMFTRRPASPFTMLPGEEHGSYYSEAQWRSLADSIRAKRPKVMLLSKYQFGRVIAASSEIASAYQEVAPGRYLLKPTTP